MQCPSGLLSLSWDPTDGAVGYISTVVSGSTGKLLYCNSTVPSCNMSNLQCGDSYSIKLQSYNGSCLSMLSAPVVIREGEARIHSQNITLVASLTHNNLSYLQLSVHSLIHYIIHYLYFIGALCVILMLSSLSLLVPCVPTNVTATRTCGSSLVNASWQASRGALSYVAFAVGEDGHYTNCFSNTTSCSFPDLHCSIMYSISVSAVDGNCSSLQSQNTTLRTGQAILVLMSMTTENINIKAKIKY